MPRATFSATVIHSTRPRSWWMNATGCRKGSRLPRRLSGLAVEEHLPGVGVWMPASSLMSVLLPAPFSPSSASTSPACTSRRDVVDRLRAAEVCLLTFSKRRQRARLGERSLPAC